MRIVAICLILALSWPGVAGAYPTDVSLKSKGLDIEAIPTLLNEATVVRLVNNEDFPVRCDVRFENGPEVTRVRKVTIDPHGDHLTRFQPTRVVIRLRVSVDCWPASEDHDGEGDGK